MATIWLAGWDLSIKIGVYSIFVVTVADCWPWCQAPAPTFLCWGVHWQTRNAYYCWKNSKFWIMCHNTEPLIRYGNKAKIVQYELLGNPDSYFKCLDISIHEFWCAHTLVRYYNDMFSFQMDLTPMAELARHIDFHDSSFCIAVIAIIFNPLFWNVVGNDFILFCGYCSFCLHL